MRKTTTPILAMALVMLMSFQAWALSTEEEIRLGTEAAARFEQQHGLVQDRQMNERLNRISSQLLAHAERQNLPWTFRVINVPQFNAAAFPGGRIYATRGLMEGLTDEELAFVIGHEIAHVDERHSVEQIESAQLRRLGLIAIAVGATKGRVNQNVETLVGLTDAVIGSSRSRDDESEADRYGMRLMARAGYDPAHALASLQKLASQGGGGTPGFLNTLLGSHPLPKDRISQGADLIASVPYRPQAKAPVTSRDGGERVFPEATSALQYTLQLAGITESELLSQRAEEIALSGSRSVFPNQQILRVSGTRVDGLTGLEEQLLRRPELLDADAFGAAVVESDSNSNTVEALVIIQGGNS